MDRAQYSDQENSDNDQNSDQENEIINVDWIKDFENEERYYTMFYPEKARSIKVDFLYVNKNKEI